MGLSPGSWIRLGRCSARSISSACPAHGSTTAGAAPLGLERPAHEPDAAVLARRVRSFADNRRRAKPTRGRHLAPPAQRVFDGTWIDPLADLRRARPEGHVAG